MTTTHPIVDAYIAAIEITASSPLNPDHGRLHAIDVFRLDSARHIATLDI
jgi:hypothetical protein